MHTRSSFVDYAGLKISKSCVLIEIKNMYIKMAAFDC